MPQTLAPLLQKRLALKARMAELPAWDPRRASYKACASAHKWLLVTCFGYLGYKNARFGRIEAHEAVTAYGREALLRAKEAAEDLGFTVLHMYVDGLWVKQDGPIPADRFPAAAGGNRRPHRPADRPGRRLPLGGLPAFPRWMRACRSPTATSAFSRTAALKYAASKSAAATPRCSLPRLRSRCWLAWHRRSTPASWRNTCRRSSACCAGYCRTCVPGRSPCRSLLVSQKLSRTLPEYRSPSPAARAAAQLQSVEKIMQPGQCVRFIYTLGEPGVHAWDAAEAPVSASVDVRRYTTLLVRAASTVLQPLGISETALRDRLFDNVVAVPEFWCARQLG